MNPIRTGGALASAHELGNRFATVGKNNTKVACHNPPSMTHENIAMTTRALSFAMSARVDNVIIKLASSKDSLTRGEVMMKEELAMSPAASPVIIAPVRPAAAPAAAKPGPRGANANTPEATQTGMLTIEAIAPAATSLRQVARAENELVRGCT